jgi:hypothetical protein
MAKIQKSGKIMKVSWTQLLHLEHTGIWYFFITFDFKARVVEFFFKVKNLMAVGRLRRRK